MNRLNCSKYVAGAGIKEVVLFRFVFFSYARRNLLTEPTALLWYHIIPWYTHMFIVPVML
jgi:hypothetical protein